MNNSEQKITIANAVEIMKHGDIVAYPTESVFGIGCDPDSKIAVERLLNIKQRSIEKGLILIAANYMQLKSSIDDTVLTKEQRETIFSIWPGPSTFVFPAKQTTPKWLTGCFNSLAVRVTNHPTVIKICQMFGKPIVSTSANISGYSPCYTAKDVRLQFGDHLPIVDGETGGRKSPSIIRDALTGAYFRM